MGPSALHPHSLPLSTTTFHHFYTFPPLFSTFPHTFNFLPHSSTFYLPLLLLPLTFSPPFLPLSLPLSSTFSTLHSSSHLFYTPFPPFYTLLHFPHLFHTSPTPLFAPPFPHFLTFHSLHQLSTHSLLTFNSLQLTLPLYLHSLPFFLNLTHPFYTSFPHLHPRAVYEVGEGQRFAILMMG